ncbi:MAG: peroxiredoxin, partial [Maioricimonas sp. JB049]
MQTVLRTIVLTGCIGLLTCGVQAAEKGKSLAVGDAAPQFSLLDDAGKEWKSSEHYGEKIVVVYFYPADMTGGCTKQACGFRDDMSKLKSEDVEVVGISGDSVRNHQLFKQAHDLNFTLLADTEGKVAGKFGVPYTPGKRTVNAVIGGKEYELVRTVTTRRWTFVIDRDGKIALINSKVKAAEDSKA